MKTIKVVELFAGVGGFRLGLEKSSEVFDFVWANQWEPGKQKQHAFECYTSHFGKSNNHINEDIAKVKHLVPNHDLLVGGFPCQDYSVASTGAKGIEGKKGVLWWEIRDIIESKKPRYVLLENVDRLLKSPSSQRGRDFGIILRTLSDLGYNVEWRIINAADYGNVQRRRRVFIFAYKMSEKLFDYSTSKTLNKDSIDNSFFSRIFPFDTHQESTKFSDGDITQFADLVLMSKNFKADFYNSGVMVNGMFVSKEVQPNKEPSRSLKSIMHEDNVDDKYFITQNLEKWKYLKGSKSIPRIKPNGECYNYTEGAIAFPDNIDLPSRTILTSESSVNRSTHVVTDIKTERLRLLTEIECERLNGFDDNWTNTGMPQKFRYFVMGNALVVDLITRIGNEILLLEQKSHD